MTNHNSITQIVLIRHGETDWNAQRRWQGHAPVPLNDQGRRQAALLGEMLARDGMSVTAIYSSDLSRAHETATIIAARLGISTVTRDERLREIDVGDWQGLTHDEVIAWDGARYEAVQKDTLHLARPGGESPHQLGERGAAAIQAIADAHQSGLVLAVTHGGTVRHIMRMLTGSEGLPGGEGISNTSRTTLHFDHVARTWHFHSFQPTPVPAPDETQEGQ